MVREPATAVEEQDTDAAGLLGRINGEAPGVGRPVVDAGETRRGSEGGGCPETADTRTKLALAIRGYRAGGVLGQACEATDAFKAF
jgi:hypothetical protein